jgi:hypothetical protein
MNVVVAARAAWLVVALFPSCAAQPPGRMATPAAAPAGPALSQRARPPDDVAEQLAAHPPLRSIVLGDSGHATVALTIREDGSVVPGTQIQSSAPGFGEACRSALAKTRWTPALDPDQRPIAVEVRFHCVFDASAVPPTKPRVRKGPHADPSAQLSVVPQPPDYGSSWYKNRDTYLDRDAFASLRLRIDPAGKAEVLGSEPDSDPRVAADCARVVNEGPAWIPARDQHGRPLEAELSFSCTVQLTSATHELSIRELATYGALSPLQLAAALRERELEIADCFQSAVRLRRNVQGSHRLAVEVSPSGEIARSEWLSSPEGVSVTLECVRQAVARVRCPAQPGSSVADIQFYVSGS